MIGETILAVTTTIGLVMQPLFLGYFILYNTYMMTLIALSVRQVRRRVAGHFVEDLDLIDESDYTKPLTMIVPAFNEEVTIVDSVTNLVQCDYPRFEVVVVNDGSSDGPSRCSSRHSVSGGPTFPIAMRSAPPGSAPPTNRPSRCRPTCRI
jgi:cellulose synthase/poly-beta-1,6-N-acetylglucosamine synthase-like glycosyltransferase